MLKWLLLLYRNWKTFGQKGIGAKLQIDIDLVVAAEIVTATEEERIIGDVRDPRRNPTTTVTANGAPAAPEVVMEEGSRRNLDLWRCLRSRRSVRLVKKVRALRYSKPLNLRFAISIINGDTDANNRITLR